MKYSDIVVYSITLISYGCCRLIKVIANRVKVLEFNSECEGTCIVTLKFAIQGKFKLIVSNENRVLAFSLYISPHIHPPPEQRKENYSEISALFLKSFQTSRILL
jgi:hypothetical protein